MKTIGKLQFISQGENAAAHLESIKAACIAGVKWVQLRIKDIEEAAYLEAAKEARSICDVYEATLIINDNPTVAKESGADGVHLGQEDMDIAAARAIVGAEAIIGGTANTWEQVEKLIEAEVNYVGLGPYRPTETKKNLSPVLGMIGYQHVLFQMEKRNLEMPIIAVGGVDIIDISTLMIAGVHGIAVSTMIQEAENKAAVVAEANDRLTF
jgi:thiamine-phosphate pyrophosphorylase